MKTKERRKDAAQRYLNALWHLYSKSDIITTMNKFCAYHNIDHNAGTILKEYKYVQKIDGQYVYAKYDAPTIHDAKFLLKKIAEARSVSKAKESLPKPMVKKIVKKKKEPNVWMYIAVISMFTTLVTMALVLLR